MEVVGEVTDAGPGAEEWVGRRVMATAVGATGAHAEVARRSGVDWPSTSRRSWTEPEAAAFFFPFHLAHLGLHERGRLEAGETVLVHAAAGGVGSAAVQLAVAAGARVIATAGASEARPRTARSARRSSSTTATKTSPPRWPRRPAAGASTCASTEWAARSPRQSLRCLARNGRHLVVGFAGGIEAEDVATITGRMLCFGQVSVLGVLLGLLRGSRCRSAWACTSCQREVGEAVHASLVELLDAGRIRPLVGRVVGFEELPAALDAMGDRATTGRVVVVR